MKLANLLLHIFSFCCFLWGLVAGDSAAAAVGSLPFWILLCAGVHESGHCLGCAIRRKRILEVRLPLFSAAEGMLSLRPAYSPVSYCRFAKSRRNWHIYLAGPVFSLILWIFLHILYCRYYGMTLLSGSVTAFLVLAANTVPFRHNDMAMVIRELFFRNENNT